MSIEDDVYTTHDRVTFAVMDPGKGLCQLVVEIAPGETQNVTLPNGRKIKVHRPLSTTELGR
jgi:hypothetical protein